MTKPLGLALAIVVAVAGAVRSDEAGCQRALDEAARQLEHRQWDLGRDALDAALVELKGVTGVARSRAEKRYAVLRQRCEAGEAGYRNKGLVEEVKRLLGDARKELTEAKDPEGAEVLLEPVRKRIEPLDPETHERFEKEIGSVEKAIRESQLGPRFDYVDGLLDHQEQDIAACGSRTNESLGAMFAIIEGSLSSLPPDHQRTKAARARLARERGAYEALARAERAHLVPEALAAWRAARAGAARPPAAPVTLASWRRDPILAHQCPSAAALIDAAEAWRASAPVRDAQEKCGDDEQLRATLSEVEVLERASRREVAATAHGILNIYRDLPAPDRGEALERALDAFAADLERIARTGPGLEAEIAGVASLPRARSGPPAPTAGTPATGSSTEKEAAGTPGVGYFDWAIYALAGIVGLAVMGLVVRLATSTPTPPAPLVMARTAPPASSPAPAPVAPPQAPPFPVASDPRPAPALIERPRPAPAATERPSVPGAPPTPAATASLARANAYFEAMTRPDPVPMAPVRAPVDVPPPEEIVRLSDEVMAQLARPGLALDHSVESLRALDASLDAPWARAGAARGVAGWTPTKAQERTFLRLGCYLGETLRLTFGGAWEGGALAADPRATRLVLASGRVVLPIEQAWKRVRDGSIEPLTALVGDERPIGPPASTGTAVPSPRRESARLARFEPPPAPWEAAPASVAFRDLRHESHLRAIAVWSVLGGALYIVLGAVMFLAPGFPDGHSAGAMSSALGVVLGILGVGLWSYHPGARWVLVTLIFLGLVTILVSSAGERGAAPVLVLQALWNGPVLWALLGGSSSMIFNGEYRAAALADTRTSVPFWRSWIFWVPLTLMALGCCFGVAAGFLSVINHRPH